MHYERRDTREDLGIPSVLTARFIHAVSRQGSRACVYIGLRLKHSTSIYRDAYCALRTIRRKSRDASSHGPPEATWIDRQTSAVLLCKRKKRAGLHGQFNGDPDLLSVFNDQQSAANRQNGSINPL